MLACAYFNIIPNQMIGAVAVLFAFGILIGEIGERLPIWNKFLGGGAMLCFLAAGLLKYFNLLPECVTNVSDGWINGYSFLNVFITFLVVGSLLGIDRDVLIKSGSLYIPTLLCSLLGACVFGVVAGLIFGNDPLYLITSYVLPIMGGGAGAGAVPMAQVYSDATGQDSAGYLSFCMAILALGNIVAILMAVVMDLIGRAFPKMTGHGELLRVKNKSLEVESKKPAPAVTVDDIAAAIFICAGFFMLGQLVSKKILPTVFGVAIPNFAYMIIFAALANIFNLIPENLREACRRCQHFCGNKLVWIQMVGMGISAINFSTMFSVASWQNVVIVLMIVIGCCVGSALFGWIVGFFPVESAITAGLCMANMGGAGDLAVLGAAKRMDLMVYAQISSRIGGANCWQRCQSLSWVRLRGGITKRPLRRMGACASRATGRDPPSCP